MQKSEAKGPGVHLVITRLGFERLARSAGVPPTPLWVNAGVLTSEELDELRLKGLDVSIFNRPIDPQDAAAIAVAAATVRQHHPHDIVWVEYSVDFGQDT